MVVLRTETNERPTRCRLGYYGSPSTSLRVGRRRYISTDVRWPRHSVPYIRSVACCFRGRVKSRTSPPSQVSPLFRHTTSLFSRLLPYKVLRNLDYFFPPPRGGGGKIHCSCPRWFSIFRLSTRRHGVSDRTRYFKRYFAEPTGRLTDWRRQLTPPISRVFAKRNYQKRTSVTTIIKKKSSTIRR